MCKFNLFLVVICLFICFTASVNADIAVVDEDFDSYSTGQLGQLAGQGDWNGGTQHSVVVDANAPSGSKCVEFKRGASADYAYVDELPDITEENRKIILNFSFKDTNNTCILYFSSSATGSTFDGPAVKISGSDNKVYTHNGTTWQALSSTYWPEQDAWAKIAIKIDNKTNTADVFYTGKTQGGTFGTLLASNDRIVKEPSGAETFVVAPQDPQGSKVYIDSVEVVARQERAINVSYGDFVFFADLEDYFHMDRPEEIKRTVHHWMRDYDIDKVYWRTSTDRLFNESFVWNYGPNDTSFEDFNDNMIEYWTEFDPPQAFIDATHAEGMEIYAWGELYNEGAPNSVMFAGNCPYLRQAQFQIDHPEYVLVDRDGNKKWGNYEFAYEDVRSYFLDEFLRYVDDVNGYDFDGLYLDFRCETQPVEHADQMGFNDIIVYLMDRRYDVNILTEDKFDYNDPAYDINDIDLFRWRDLRGRYVTRLLEQFKDHPLMEGKKLAVAIPRSFSAGPHLGNITLDWEKWISDGIVDELIVGSFTGMWQYPDYRNNDEGYLAVEDINIYLDANSIAAGATYADGFTRDLTDVNYFDFYRDFENNDVDIYYWLTHRMRHAFYDGHYSDLYSYEESKLDGLVPYNDGMDGWLNHNLFERPWATAYVYTDFNDFNTGNLDDQGSGLNGPWEATSAHKIQTTYYHDGTRCVESIRDGASPAYIEFDTIDEPMVDLTMWFRRTDTNASCLFYLTNEVGGGVKVGIWFNPVGDICLWNGSSWSTIETEWEVTIPDGLWCHVRILVDRLTDEINIYAKNRHLGNREVIIEGFSVADTNDLSVFYSAVQEPEGKKFHWDKLQIWGMEYDPIR